MNEYEICVIVFDDISVSSKIEYLDQLFIRGRLENLDIYYLFQSYLDLPKRTIRKNSNKINLFNQTLKDFERLYKNVGGYDKSFDEF